MTETTALEEKLRTEVRLLLNETSDDYDLALVRWHLGKLHEESARSYETVKDAFLFGWRIAPRTQWPQRIGWLSAGICIMGALVLAVRGDASGFVLSMALGVLCLLFAES